MVQIYDPEDDDVSKAFTMQLVSHLKKYNPVVRYNIRDITHDVPLLVLCKNLSRIATDIKYATKGLPDEMKTKDTAVIIFHVKQKSQLPTIMTSEIITDETCLQFVLVDFGFDKDTLALYSNCSMNTTGKMKLSKFLDEKRSVKSTNKDVRRQPSESTASTSLDVPMEDNMADGKSWTIYSNGSDTELREQPDSQLTEYFLKPMKKPTEKPKPVKSTKRRRLIIVCEDTYEYEKHIDSSETMKLVIRLHDENETHKSPIAFKPGTPPILDMHYTITSDDILGLVDGLQEIRSLLQ